MRITLVRHGKPTVELSGSFHASELSELSKAYDSSGISDTPPPQTIDALQGNRRVVCSHLTRSLDSAQALGFTTIHTSDALFCETALPHFDTGSIRLPIGVWIIVLRILWLFGFSRNGESFSDAKKRSRAAAQSLIKMAMEHNTVLLVGHGLSNYLIARELTSMGWRGPSKPGRKYWDFGIYHYPAQ